LKKIMLGLWTKSKKKQGRPFPRGNEGKRFSPYQKVAGATENPPNLSIERENFHVLQVRREPKKEGRTGASKDTIKGNTQLWTAWALNHCF